MQHEISVSKIVPSFHLGAGALSELSNIIKDQISMDKTHVIIYIDHFFKDKNLIEKLNFNFETLVFYIDSSEEPTTDGIDELINQINILKNKVACVVGIGGGSTLDTAKAVSNLINNPGKAEDYQGWNLVKRPGVFKIGVPTISGTGAEASRTCVLTNKKKNLKLGMNSPYTVFNHLILDPELSKTVPKEQYFFTAMDTYIHCFESLRGNYRHLIADALSRESLTQVREVLLSDDLMTLDNRLKLLSASFLGGTSIGNSYVGIVHPISAGLSTVFGIKHCLANCLALNGLEEFYPEEHKEMHSILKKHKIDFAQGMYSNLSEEQYLKLYQSSIVHEKPLINALGSNFKQILTFEKVKEIYRKI